MKTILYSHLLSLSTLIPQNQFRIDLNAFSCLQESYCVTSRLNSNYSVMVVKLNEP